MGELQGVKLNNGEIEEKNTVIITYQIMTNLFSEDPIALYELYQLAKNPDHKIFGNKKDVLEKHGLLRDGVFFHESTKNIVLSAHKGDGLETEFINPIDCSERNNA